MTGKEQTANKRRQQIRVKVLEETSGIMGDFWVAIKNEGWDEEEKSWYFDSLKGLFHKNIDLAISKTAELLEKVHKKEIEDWKQQFAQAEMLIGDIKWTTGCKSNDGVAILESVENLKEDTAKAIFDDIEKVLSLFSMSKDYRELKKKWCEK